MGLIIFVLAMLVLTAVVIVGAAVAAYQGKQLPLHYVTIPLAAIAGMTVMALARSL